MSKNITAKVATVATAKVVAGQPAAKKLPQIKKGMLVTGKYSRVLADGVLVELVSIIGQVDGNDVLKMLDKPVAVVGKVEGKQHVREFLGKREERDGLLEAMTGMQPADLQAADAVTVEVLDVDTSGYKPRFKLSEAGAALRIARGDMKVGDVRTVEVVDIAPFGAFCQLNEVEQGLLHNTQQTRRVRLGEKVEVKVIETGKKDNGRTTWGLSMKAIVEDQQAAKRAEAEAKEQVNAAAEVERAAQQKVLVAAGELQDGFTGQASVRRVEADKLVVLLGVYECELPNDKLVFPRASVAKVGNKFTVHVVSTDKETGKVVVGTKHKEKSGKK